MNPERHSFYALLWHLGTSQSDLALLCAEDINWEDQTISFDRLKVRWRGQRPPIIQFGPEAAILLKKLPKKGALFPYLCTVEAKHRTTEFRQRCLGLKIYDICLHSYRYAWAERAKVAGMPERFAQQMLGHNSKAVHRAYAKKALLKIPSLEEFETRRAKSQIIKVQFDGAPIPPVSEPALSSSEPEAGPAVDLSL